MAIRGRCSNLWFNPYVHLYETLLKCWVGVFGQISSYLDGSSVCRVLIARFLIGIGTIVGASHPTHVFDSKNEH
jgi:hypothetical protein